MALSEPTPDTLAAVVAAGAAVASAIYAWQGSRTAKRALRIAEQDHKERHAGLAAYLIDGRVCEGSEGEELVAFACSISNTANAPLSITRTDLHVHVFDDAGKTSEIILQPSARGIPSIWDLPALELPLNLGARSTASGWLCYRLPARVVQALSIDKYEVVILSSSGDRATFESYLLQRISDASRSN